MSPSPRRGRDAAIVGGTTTIPPIARRRRPGRPRRLRPPLADAAALALLPLLAGAGFHAVGPSSIESGRSLYNEAIARTSTEQLPLELVRLRYREVPILLEVTSVSTPSACSPGRARASRSA